MSTSSSRIELLLEVRIMLTCTVNLPLIITDIHVNVLLCPHLTRAWESCWSVSTHCRVTNLLLNCIAEMNRFDLLSNYFCSTIEFYKILSFLFLGENSIFFVADEAITDANYTQVINKLCNMYFTYTLIIS